MPRSNLAKTITLRVSLVPRLQVYHKEEIKKDPRATNEDFGGFLNDKLEQLLDKEEYAKNNFPNCSVLSISDNVIYIKDRVLKGVVEVYYMFLNDLMTSRLFCQYDESFSCVHIVYAVATLDVAKLDPGAYKEARDKDLLTNVSVLPKSVIKARKMFSRFRRSLYNDIYQGFWFLENLA